MRRPVAVKESAEASFAGLLDRLTLGGRPMPAEGEFSADGVARNVPADTPTGPGSGRLALSRQLRQSPQPKSAASRIATDGVELSYEKALQRHSRRLPAAEPDLNLDLLPVASPLTSQTKEASSGKPVGPAANAGKIPGASKRAVPKSKTQSTARRKQTANVASVKEEPGSRRPVTQQSQTVSKVRAPTRSRREASGKPKSSIRSEVSASTPKRATRNPLQPFRSQAAAKHAALERPSEFDRSLTLKQNKPAQLDLVSQRRAIISVRLSEAESQKLRQRAAESGISISAYMRSCVLDADHLRAQVKQALAEMRASIGRSEASQLPVVAGQQLSGGWLRLISRSAALLLAPLLSLRHRV